MAMAALNLHNISRSCPRPGPPHHRPGVGLQVPAAGRGHGPGGGVAAAAGAGLRLQLELLAAPPRPQLATLGRAGRQSDLAVVGGAGRG